MSKRVVKIIATFIVIAVFFVFSALGYLHFVKGPALTVTQPFVRIISSSTSKIQSFFSSLLLIKRQLNERTKLEKELSRLKVESTKLLIFQEENEVLRELLSLRKSLNFVTAPAQVVSREPAGVRSAVVINKGENSGVSPGNAVIDEQGNLLGIVGDVFKNTAFVILITDGTAKIDVEIASQDTLGVLSGSHGLSLNLELVSQGAKVTKGDKVITSGLTGEVPYGLLAGFIEEQQTEGLNLFQKISVLPSGDIKNFRFVLVITDF